jgi:hypothetical protein
MGHLVPCRSFAGEGRTGKHSVANALAFDVKTQDSFDAECPNNSVSPGPIPQQCRWRTECLVKGMSALAFKVSRKSGEYVKPSLVPNHSKQTHFGVLDGTIVGFFLACAAGLVYLLLKM